MVKNINKAIFYNITVTSILKGKYFKESNIVNIYPTETEESELVKQVISDVDNIVESESGEVYQPLLYHSQCSEILADYDSDNDLYKNYVIKNYKN